MLLKIPTEQQKKLIDALTHAGTKEIGGQLFGEQLAPSCFRVTNIAIQKRKGSFASFFVDLAQAAKDAAKFFERTRHDYSRFNYLGEWHSHPSFTLTPSTTDRRTMHDLVKDPAFTGSFAVLMITRMKGQTLAAQASLFDPSGKEIPVALELESDEQNPAVSH